MYVSMRFLSLRKKSDMKTIKGNYIWWAAVRLAAGILFVVLSIFWKVELPFIMIVSFLPLIAFDIWFYHGRDDDEREKHLLLKVYSRSGSVIIVLLTYIYFIDFIDKADISWIHALLSLWLISRGGFGLFYFIRE